jgi:hypothetical protein
MAVQLAGDRAKRDRLAGEIVTRRSVLFDDLEPIRALERSLIEFHAAGS